jgi:hypothetical protein
VAVMSMLLFSLKRFDVANVFAVMSRRMHRPTGARALPLILEEPCDYFTDHVLFPLSLVTE